MPTAACVSVMFKGAELATNCSPTYLTATTEEIHYMQSVYSEHTEVDCYATHACAKGLSNQFCPSVCQFVSPVKNFEISTFTGLIAVHNNDMAI